MCGCYRLNWLNDTILSNGTGTFRQFSNTLVFLVPTHTGVWNKLNAEERLLERLDPIFLQRRDNERWATVWPESEPLLKVKQLRDYFARYDFMPILANDAVLSQTIAFGVQRGLFAYGLGDGENLEFDTLYFNEQHAADNFPITESAWLVRATLAEGLLAPDDAPEPDPGDPPNPNPEPAPAGHQPDPIVPAPTPPSYVYQGLHIETGLDAMQWGQFYRSVIQPLLETGADLEINLTINVTKADGLDANLVDLRVKESALQLGTNTRVKIRDRT